MLCRCHQKKQTFPGITTRFSFFLDTLPSPKENVKNDNADINLLSSVPVTFPSNQGLIGLDKKIHFKTRN